MPVPGAQELGELAGKGFDSILEHLGGEGAAQSAKAGLRSSMLAQESEFKRSAEGMNLYQRIQAFDMKRSQIQEQLNKPLKMATVAAKSSVQDLKSTIGDLHKNFTATGNVAAKDTGQLLQLDPEHANRTILEVNQANRGQATLLARKMVMGENNENLIGDIMNLYDHPDPVMHSHANVMLDIISNHFNDITKIKGAPASRTKLDVLKALTLESRYRDAFGLKPLAFDVSKFNTGNVRQASNAWEQFASRRARIFLAPLIAINHVSTFFNLSWAPLTAMGKAMSTWGDKDIQDLVESSGIFASQGHSIIDQEIRARTGMIASTTGSSEAGNIVNQVFHTPGFNWMRGVQLKLSGLLGYHAATEWAAKAVEGDSRAIAELREMNLPIEDIVKNGGKLTPDQYRQAVWHFANNRVFIEKSLDRSLLSRRSPWTRMATMFHGYVTNQQRFMRRELQKMYNAKDYVGIARVAGTFGIIFPLVAPMIRSAEIFGRTASPGQAGHEFSEDYRKLLRPKNADEFIRNYLDLLSYFGSLGTLHSFVSAAHSDRLATALMGPIFGPAARTTQDIVNLTRATKTGKHSLRPLAQDVLQQTVPIGGNIAMAHLFPKKEE
jgi:hypothetical protein